MTKLRGYPLLAAIGLTCLLLLVLLPLNASAQGGDAAKLEKVEVACDPPQQGLGGEVEITATVYISGGCCYHLYTYDVVPTLIMPEQLVLVSGPSPASYEEMDGLPGGVSSTKDFKWTLRSDAEGDFEVKVLIDTKNSGSAEGDCMIKYTTGAKITSPMVFPAEPEVGSSLQINFHAEPTMAGVTLEEIKLYYLISDTEFDTVLEANMTDLVVLQDGKVQRKAGTEVPVEQDPYDETLYKATIDSLKKEGHLYYWMSAKDSKGESSTSSHYTAEVKDVDQVYLIKNLVGFGIIVFGIVGMLIIFLYNNRRVRNAIRDRTRLFRLGSQGNTEYMDEAEKKKVERPQWFYVMVIGMIILAVIAVALIVLAVWNNSYSELFTHLKEGK